MVSLVSPQTQLDSLPPGGLPPYFLRWFITGLSILHHIHCLAAATWFPLVVGCHKLFLIGLQHISIQFTHIYTTMVVFQPLVFHRTFTVVYHRVVSYRIRAGILMPGISYIWYLFYFMLFGKKGSRFIIRMTIATTVPSFSSIGWFFNVPDLRGYLYSGTGSALMG